MEMAADGILLLLFVALVAAPRKLLTAGVVGAWLFVVFLVSVSGQQHWSSWLPWVSFLGSLACFGVWAFRKFAAPAPISNSSQSKDNE
jgi:hypothetical protein